jgi:small subunit ribosomal protein S9
MKRTQKSQKPIAHGVGRRKSSVARAWLKKGSGAITVNGKDFKEYFTTEVTRLDAAAPFQVIPTSATFDIEANVQGGGFASQAGAIRLAIARALVLHDETVRPVLRQYNFLTVDSRLKERKKYGKRAARRSFQFVKR